ncbi:MAG TPA: hypothetical protein PLW93_03970 [Candidatus Absconditabacterales bacterium]|nr:hypothetical protein [Candidatus Absconditabacterales bacterium]HNG97401.1 hypothetical protein [Candidatus Absconditabacterales bacterium]
MQPSSLPRSYADEINLQEKLSDTELQATIAEIEELRADAAKYQAKGDTDLASTLTKKFHQVYEALKAHYPVYAELKAQWKQFSKDLKKIDELEADYLSTQTQHTELKTRFEASPNELARKEQQLQELKERMNSPRSGEARKLAEQSHGKIVLRPDGKIDFPELGIKGMGRLSVEGPTDLENGLVQGDHVDQHGNRGVPGLSYMTGKRAMQEAGKQGKKLFPAAGAGEKTNALLATLGVNGAEQTKALQVLFGADFSGFWHPDFEEWLHVGSVSSLGVSEVNTGGDVSAVNFGASAANRVWDYRSYPQPFLACEDC